MGRYDPERELVAPDYWCAPCVFCRREDLKKNMVRLSAAQRYANPKTLCHVCHRCFERLCLAAGQNPDEFAV